ncbi:Pheromone-regulated membrane protein 10 [Colletotrichum sp. SAR 10_70]|nr:Pheromone-regulated membrane protein 10 [Colletotrichum sp. SAR 10_71]KAI8171502.1 Pheromone-regulated membrane protein 10 [Colletotrichum sp. SAR 10_70]KAI8176916.1 Pheromone-regulated membrane protein 10 [Colletotrichum sp. SAR 10_75]KAI8209679.1 Pheromone-regulated membrane protein 10 [Colletotrichum sp. SAR 10_76]KAI8233490.1 Pheromone-regulated membrane protein 10 [Colletotrichum sp. SAR 10_77]
MVENSTASQDDDPGPEPGGGMSPGFASGSASGSTTPENAAATPNPDPAEQSTSNAEAAAAAALKKEKGRVRFNSRAAVTQPPTSPPPNATLPVPTPANPPRPSILRGSSGSSIPTVATLAQDNPRPSVDSERQEAKSAAAAAQERARQVAANIQLGSPTRESRVSVESAGTTTASEYEPPSREGAYIPLQDLNSDQPLTGKAKEEEEKHEHQAQLNSEAYRIVRAHTWRIADKTESEAGPSNAQDAEKTEQTDHLLPEVNDGNYDGVYVVPPPKQYRGSVLSQLLKLYKPAEGPVQPPNNRNSVASFSNFGGPLSTGTPGSESGTTTPTGTATPSRKKWYQANRSQETLVNLIEASARLANPNQQGEGPGSPKDSKAAKKQRPKHKRTTSNSRISAYLAREEEEAKITVHIAETLARQEYIITLCRALMLFGAPTHRLEEYLSTTAKVLEIDGQFLYLPGCMVISFDDRSVHTTEVRMVRAAQGIDLGKLRDTHHVYKEVIHDVVSVNEGIERLDALIKSKDKFHVWIRVLVFGLTSVTAAPFSFGARLIDLPLAFCFGCLVGFLQLIVAAQSKLYSNVLEVTATVLVSFLARAFGSIRGGNLFCFSAIAQGGIVMLLPGYMVLCSALELQSRAIVPGSIRIVYAVIYSLFLGFGITIGTAIYGLIDENAVSTTTCENQIPTYLTFIFVPLFVVCIAILYQAKWRQMPVMLVVAFAGYMVNYFSGLRFSAAPQVANTLGALTVGVLANLYSRVRHGVAAATLIPAIFTQVPGGLASTGGLLSGLTTANKITNSTHSVNGTSSVTYDSTEMNSVVFNVAASMIQIAIGIAVGLFLSSLIIYPLGKRRSGLFSF